MIVPPASFNPSVWLPFCLPPASVIHGGNKTVVKGKQVSLSCLYGLPEKVQQILWKKVAGRGVFQEVASFAKRSDPVIEEQYTDRTSLTRSLSDSQLTFYPVKLEDEGCYTCQFHTYPDGTKSATSCLAVFGMSLINYVRQNVKGSWASVYWVRNSGRKWCCVSEIVSWLAMS